MGTLPTSRMQVKRGAAPDEDRPFAAHGHAEIFHLGKSTVMRQTFEPGWKWSQDIAPIAGTKTCQANHACYVLAGRIHCRMDDGSEFEVGPGDFFEIGPGHDAWVLGNEPCVMVDFGGYEQYAKPHVVPRRQYEEGENSFRR